MMKTTKNTKELYITEIPSDWVVKKLGEISVIKTGDKDTQNKVEDGLYPFFVRSDNVERINSFSYDGEAILTSGDGVGVGNNFHYIIGKFDFHQRVYSIRKFNSETFGKFIYYYFSEKFYERVIKLSAKNSVDSVRMEMIFDMKIPLPPLPEQIAIAQVLSTADAAIHTSEKLIAQKELRKKWLMQQLLTGKKRLKGFGGEVKLKVVEHFLKEVSERNKDLKITNVLSVTNSRGFINQAEQFDRVVASEDATNYKIIRKEQFAYNPSRVNVGSLDLLRDFESGILSPMYVVFETDKSQLLPDYFYYQLKTQWFYGHIPMFVQGSVRDSLSLDGLCSMKFYIPSIEEQTAIAQVLQAADKEISLLKAKAEKLREQKKGLMQQLLTGKVRLKINNT